MNIEQLTVIIGGLALSHNPESRARAALLVEREQFILQARMGRMPDLVIARMSTIAESVGPMTLLPNTAVWRAVWLSMIRSVMRGDPPIPDDAEPVRWARAVWRELYGTDPDIRSAAAFMALIDALKRACVLHPAP